MSTVEWFVIVTDWKEQWEVLPSSSVTASRCEGEIQETKRTNMLVGPSLKTEF